MKPKKEKSPKQMLKDLLSSLSTRERGLYKKSKAYLTYKKNLAGTTTPPYLPKSVQKIEVQTLFGGTKPKRKSQAG